MLRKTVSGVMLTLLFVGMLMFTSDIQLVGASGTIYIRPNGDVDPPTAPILRNGNLYQITSDINGSIVIERDNVVLDGNNKSLYGGAQNLIGVDLANRKNVTITRLCIKNFSFGIWLSQSHNNTLFGNILIGNDYGIRLSESNYNNITANIVTNSKLHGLLAGAVFLWKSNYNTLVDNKIMDNQRGLIIWFGMGNTLKRNLMVNNTYSFKIDGRCLSEYINDVDHSNTINGKPIYYWINRHNETVSLDAGAVIIINSTNITVENLTITNNVEGIKLAYTQNSQIRNVTVTNNEIGVVLQYSHYNTVTKVNASNNALCGIYLDRSNFNLVINNTAINNVGLGVVIYSGGIYFEDTLGNVFMNNLLANNTQGIGGDESWQIRIIGNDIIGNHPRGIMLGQLVDSTIAQNNIMDNKVGIWIFQYSPAENKIYHNNFINNSRQIVMYLMQGSFKWNDDYPFGGNYWSDYNGTDLFSGLYQNETGMDGMGDAPYIIDEDNQDCYPLMNPWHPTDISLVNVTPSQSEVYVGQSINITVNVLNRGDIPETFAVTCKYELEGVEYVLESTVLVNLPPNTPTTLIFSWPTTDVATYRIKAEATILPDELNPADNSMTSLALVKVKMVGDVNGDNRVNIEDLAIVSLAFGTRPGYPRWNVQADLNQDGKVDIYDLVIVAQNYGKTYP